MDESERIRTIRQSLPSPLRFLIDEDDPPEELRLYLGRRAATARNGRIELTHLICTKELMEETLRSLTNRSFYSHSENMANGFFTSSCSLRVGVAGSAVNDRQTTVGVKDVSFLCIRIPRQVNGAADELLKRLAQSSFSQSVLICSPPGVGKTTVLRELARRLSSEPCLFPVALIDEREELCFGLEDCPALTVYKGYPKAHAIEISLRTASPRFLICDEISPKESEALLECGRGGVCVAASMHAGSLEELMRRPRASALLKSGIFDLYAGLTREKNKLHFDFAPIGREEKP